MSIFRKSWVAVGAVIAACAMMLAPADAWAQSADISVAKSGPASVQSGQNASYTFSGTAGQRVSLNITGVSFSYEIVSIINPTGTTLVGSGAVGPSDLILLA